MQGRLPCAGRASPTAAGDPVTLQGVPGRHRSQKAPFPAYPRMHPVCRKGTLPGRISPAFRCTPHLPRWRGYAGECLQDLYGTPGRLPRGMHGWELLIVLCCITWIFWPKSRKCRTSREEKTTAGLVMQHSSECITQSSTETDLPKYVLSSHHLLYG